MIRMGAQIEEALVTHRSAKRREAGVGPRASWSMAAFLPARPDFPYELSGGQKSA